MQNMLFHPLLHLPFIYNSENVLKMVDVGSTEQIIAWELCTSVEAALSQMNPAYLVPS